MAGITNGTNGSGDSNGKGGGTMTVAMAATIGDNPIESWSKERKLEKLANYSACQASECKCFGFKVPIQAETSSGTTGTGAMASQKAEMCRACAHGQAEHIRQYAGLDDGRLNRFLQTALDVETLFSLICKEEDADSKHIYFFLFKLLRKSILNKESMTTAAEPASAASDPATVAANPSLATGRIFLKMSYFILDWNIR
jgi:histone acetyltransferase